MQSMPVIISVTIGCPTVRQSLLVFGGLLLFLVLISLKALKRYPFTFLGEKE